MPVMPARPQGSARAALRSGATPGDRSREAPPRRLLELLLVDAHLWVSLAAAGLTLFVAAAQGLPSGVPAAGVVFAATLLIYAVDDLVDRRHAGAAGAGLAWQLAVGALLLGLQLERAPAPAVAVVLAGGLPAILYAAPVRGRRLRDLPGVKPLFVSGALTVAVIAVPHAWVAVPISLDTAPLAAALFALVLGNVCLFDLRDLAADARDGVATVPVCLGGDGARALSALLATVVVILGARRSAPGGPALAVAGAATLLCAWRLRPGSGRLAFSLAVDGIPVALGVWTMLG